MKFALPARSTGTYTPDGHGMVELYKGVRDEHGDPVVLIRMAMDRETAEAVYAAARSDCPDAHQRLANILADIALGALQLHMTPELAKLTS